MVSRVPQARQARRANKGPREQRAHVVRQAPMAPMAPLALRETPALGARQARQAGPALTGADGATGATGATGPAGSDGESTHSNVQLSSTYVEPNVALTIVAYLTGWADGEGVSLSLVSGEDGSTTAWGSGAADATGMAMVELTHDGLGSGFYSVLATGAGGGKASDVLVSGDKPLAQ